MTMVSSRKREAIPSKKRKKSLKKKKSSSKSRPSPSLEPSPSPSSSPASSSFPLPSDYPDHALGHPSEIPQPHIDSFNWLFGVNGGLDLITKNLHAVHVSPNESSGRPGMKRTDYPYSHPQLPFPFASPSSSQWFQSQLTPLSLFL